MLPTSPPPLCIDRVTLFVHDLDRVRRFYERAIGLRELDAGANFARLGAGDRALVELRREPRARPRSPHGTGLFHAAFLLPTRAALGRWAVHAARAGLPVQGASDHGVSEAIYLADPEGNGVEVYADRPRSTWRWRDNLIALTTAPLDADDLMAAAGPELWRGAPDGTVVGHVHLQVGALAPAEAFYAGVLGVPVTARYPGASFYGSGYHHHLATNVWNSCGAAPRTEPTAGLAAVALVAANAATLDGVAARAAESGLDPERHGAGLVLRDPWNTVLTLDAPE